MLYTYKMLYMHDFVCNYTCMMLNIYIYMMLLELLPQVLPHNFSISILTLLGVGSPPPNPVPWIQHMSLLLVVQSIRIPMIYEWNIYPIGMVFISHYQWLISHESPILSHHNDTCLKISLYPMKNHLFAW